MHAYVDRELDTPRSVDIELHLQQCDACRRDSHSLLSLREALRTHLARRKAPASLRDSLTRELRGAAPTARVDRRPWIASAAAAAMVVLAVGLVLQWPMGGTLGDRVSDQIIAAHVRALQVDHLTDVASSDAHTVKPWFNGRLDFSPPVLDLTGEGYPLIGGRLDYVNERPVAALAYRHRQHLINLFIWPEASAGGAAPQLMAQQGYHLLHWRQAGLNYWLISDLNRADLENLSRRLRAGGAG